MNVYSSLVPGCNDSSDCVIDSRIAFRSFLPHLLVATPTRPGSGRGGARGNGPLTAASSSTAPPRCPRWAGYLNRAPSMAGADPAITSSLTFPYIKPSSRKRNDDRQPSQETACACRRRSTGPNASKILLKWGMDLDRIESPNCRHVYEHNVAGKLVLHKEVKATECALYQLRDQDPLELWHRHRALIIGDAAHPMLPHLGQGGSQSIEDAEALAYVLRTSSGLPELGHVEEALKRFQKLRHFRASISQERSRLQALGPRPGSKEELLGKNPTEFAFFLYDYQGAEEWEQRMKEGRVGKPPGGPPADVPKPASVTEAPVPARVSA
ncbi:hypothetical protein L1887_57878 [Cichorium endivia]|nr:hypothetical protein L1887_57878 [Cichorium endivia]